jgi:hypothetical protein
MVGKPKLTPEQRAANRKEQIKAWRDKNQDYNEKYYQVNKDRAKDQLQQNYRQTKENAPWVIMARTAKTRAKERNLEYKLDAEYLKSIWTDICPVLGIPIKAAVYESGTSRTHKSKPQDQSPTLDRIDSTKGYVKGNVAVMSYRANMIKNCGTAEEHRLIADFIDRSIGQHIFA